MEPKRSSLPWSTTEYWRIESFQITHVCQFPLLFDKFMYSHSGPEFLALGFYEINKVKNGIVNKWSCFTERRRNKE